MYKYDSNIKIDGIVYKVTNMINNKAYIGQTIHSLNKRKIKHLNLATRSNIKTHFHRAINKYGETNFVWQILCSCNRKAELDKKEVYYIEYYDTYKNGYNMTLGGEGTVGRICKESTKCKISKAKTGKKMSEEFKKKLSTMRRGVKKSKAHVVNVVASKSKYWDVVYPNGTHKVIKNLSAFCRENNLNDSGMRLVALYGRNHHRGFKCQRIDNIKASQ